MTVPVSQLMAFYQQACEMDIQAFKPGNVSVFADGHGMVVEDFRRSFQVSAKPICSSDYSLGEKIYFAIKATREAVGCNTNLGIVLLCAPLIQAANNMTASMSLRQSLSLVLSSTTIKDAEWVFKAIALAAPGGLGNADEQDVNEPPSVNLQYAMKLASEKDRIALQYTSDYQDVFNFSLLRYNDYLEKWGSRDWAAALVYIELLSTFPDSHVERKYGNQYRGMIQTEMLELGRSIALVNDPEQLKPRFFRIDRLFKSHGINPGTTADLIVATVLTAFLEDWSQLHNYL